MSEEFYEIFRWVAAILISLIGMTGILIVGGLPDWIDNWKNKKKTP